VDRDTGERPLAAGAEKFAPAGGEQYSRSLSLLALICAAALFLLLAKPLLRGTVYVLNDLGNFHLPCRWFYRNALLSGDSFLWIPSVFCGAYLYGEGQTGMLHPLHLLLYRTLPLQVAFNLELLASYAFMFPGMALLLRRLGLPGYAGLFGAMAFTFCGFNMLHFIHMNAVVVVAHIPWLLLCIDLALHTTDRRKAAASGLGISLLTGSQLLLGHPQMVLLSLIAEAAFAAWRCAGSAGIRRLPGIVAAIALGGLIGAVQIVPTLDVASRSTRSNPSVDFSMSDSLHQANMVQLISPFGLKHIRVGEGDLHEFGLYSGAFCTLAPIWLALRRGGRSRSTAKAAALFGVVMLLLAFGQYGRLYPLFAHLPPVSMFRVPARFIALVHLAMAILAALAFWDLVELQRDGERVAWRALWPIAIPFALSAVIAVASIPPIHAALRLSDEYDLASIYRTGLCTIWMLIGTALVLAAARGVRWCLPAIVLFVCADLGAWGLHYVWSVPDRTIDGYLRSARPRPVAPAGERLFLPLSYGLSYAVTMEGVRNAGGYLGLEPESALDCKRDAAAQRIADVAWSFAPLAGQGRWLRVTDPLPRARLVTGVKVSDSPGRAVSRIDPARTAILDRPIAPLSGPAGSAAIVEERPGRIMIATQAQTPQLLVLSERFHSGWRAEQDGHAVPVLRVYGDFQGCVVGAGRHRVLFLFEPASFRNGVLLSLAGLLSAFAWFATVLRGARARLAGSS
jgi:hypothetical protein